MPRIKSKTPRGKTVRVIAVTGVTEFLGKELIRLLENDSRYHEVLAVDVRRPVQQGSKTLHVDIDLTMPEAGQRLSAVFRDHAVDTLVHLAFLSHPIHDTSYAHELQVIGTIHLLNAAAAAGLSKIVMLGSTLSYGARPDNPNFLTEDAPLRGVAGCPQIQDLIEAEEQLLQFAQKNPKIVTTVLRMGSMLGASVEGFMAKLLSANSAPTILGYDPLFQFLHEVDALDALKIAVDKDLPGIFNIVADGVMTYSTILRLGGRIPLPIPHFFGNRIGGFLWAMQAIDIPPSFLEYLRYLWVADGSKAKQQLGFNPKYTTRETVLNFIRLGRLRRTPLLSDDQG